MKTLRIIFLSLSALLFAGSVAGLADGIKHDNMEQVVNYTAFALLSLAAPAVADPNFKRSLVGFMGGGLSRVEEHLISWLERSGKVDNNTAAQYRSGRLRLVSAFFYLRYKITGLSGIQEILNAQSTKETGITNLHQGKLDKGVNACIDRILVGYATHASTTDPKEMTGYDSVVTGWPAGLANGHIHVKVDGAMAQDPIPLALCGSQADSTVSRGKLDSFQLNTPIVLEEQKQITLELDLPVASFGSNQHHVEIFLLGTKTRQRSDF